MKHQKENKTNKKNSLSTNVPVCYKIITLQNHSTFFFFFEKQICVYNKLDLGVRGRQNYVSLQTFEKRSGPRWAGLWSGLINFRNDLKFLETSLFKTSIFIFVNLPAKAFRMLSSICYLGLQEPKLSGEHGCVINSALLLPSALCISLPLLSRGSIHLWRTW